jgi:antimicrobial peptide system SdpB family protein
VLTRLGSFVAPMIARNPWTNVYGFARSLLACGTLSTLLTSPAITLLQSSENLVEQPPFCSQVLFPTLFCIAPQFDFELARWLAVSGLLVVASGWRPRVTGILHWWLSYSLKASAMLTDGGDQITSNLTLLLIPLTLTDHRLWHWQSPSWPGAVPPIGRTIVAWSTVVMIRLQVAVVYWHAAVGKTRVTEWADGTAAYYWFSHPNFGAVPPLDVMIRPLITSSVGVLALTWGAILLEIVLFMALTMPRRAWPFVLALGIGFHTAIAVIHGLPSFSLAMVAALTLYLRPAEQELQWCYRLAAGMSRRLRFSRPAESAVGEPIALRCLCQVREILRLRPC